MAILTLRVPQVKTETNGRPAGCPHCGSSILQRWGPVAKPIRDTLESGTIQIYRYKCSACGRTFRHYPTGVDSADQTERLRVAAAMLWALGLSLRSATAMLGVFGVRLCHQTVWRDAIVFAAELGRRRPRGLVPVLGVDGTGARIKGQSRGLVVALDMGSGDPIAVAHLDEQDAEAVTDWLAPLIEQFGVEVIVTDDLNSYATVAKSLHVDRQRCVFHLKRWTGRTIKVLREQLDEVWHPTLDDVERILEELPPEGGHLLCNAWQQIEEPPPREGEEATPLYRFRLMLIRLSNAWHEYRLFARRSDVPTTNNPTEYAMGRYKLRRASMRGVKSETGNLAIFQLCHAGLLS